MKRTMSMIGALAVAAIGFLFAASAAQAATEGPYNGVACTDYPVTNGNYPADGSHFKTCFSYLTTNAEIIKNRMYGANVDVRNLLQQQNVTVYYFANRTASDLFFSGNPNYGSGFHDPNARCGHTKYLNGKIVIAIYDSCTFQSGQVTNPDRAKVTSHEKGHAFAFALAKSQGISNSAPDRSVAYKALGDYDRNQIGNIATICQIFGQHLPSAFELQLGASSGQVCSSTNQILAPYTGLTAKQIHDLRAPYFVNPPSNSKYAELWAEQFSILDNGVGGQYNQFNMTDTTIGNNRLRCTMHVVTSFWHTQKPVGPNNPHISFRSFPVQWGCPAVTEAQQWQ